MAFVEHRHCDPCGQPRPHTNGSCNACVEREHRLAEAAWSALTTDEKLLDLKRRLDVQERRPHRY